MLKFYKLLFVVLLTAASFTVGAGQHDLRAASHSNYNTQTFPNVTDEKYIAAEIKRSIAALPQSKEEVDILYNSTFTDAKEKRSVEIFPNYKLNEKRSHISTPPKLKQNGSVKTVSKKLNEELRQKSCGLWKNRKKDGSCECGDSLDGTVLCDPKEQTQVSVLQCFCMSAVKENGKQMIIVGHCIYGCFKDDYLFRYKNYSNLSDLTSPCIDFNRMGPFCGQCKSGHGVLAFSYSLKCVPCKFRWLNVVKYIFAAYGPLTLFMIFIMVFTVSINSAPLNGFILVAQILSCSITVRLLDAQKLTHDNPNAHLSIFALTIYGIWNLDFFRTLYSNLCLHPSFSILKIISLDYLIALYPLVIIALVYVLVEMHSRDVRLVVLLWKPFHCIFACCRHQLNIRTSLVDAFGTFFSLSYVKILSTTTDLIIALPTWDSTGQQQHPRMYFDPTVHFFSTAYIPYAAAIIPIFLLFNVFPIIFILLYPRQWFQRRLPRTVGRMLQPIMDTLLGAYRDGRGGDWDCRYFPAVFLIFRISIFGTSMAIPNALGFIFITMLTILTGMLVAVIKPYRSAVYNTVDTTLLLVLALFFAGLSSFFFAYTLARRQIKISTFLAIAPVTIPFLYMLGFSLYHIFWRGRIPRLVLAFLRRTNFIECYREVWALRARRYNHNDQMVAFPNANERTPLI